MSDVLEPILIDINGLVPLLNSLKGFAGMQIALRRLAPALLNECSLPTAPTFAPDFFSSIIRLASRKASAYRESFS